MPDWRDAVRQDDGALMFGGIPIRRCDPDNLVDYMIAGINALPPQPASLYATTDVVMMLKGWTREQAIDWLKANARREGGMWWMLQSKLAEAPANPRSPAPAVPSPPPSSAAGSPPPPHASS